MRHPKQCEMINISVAMATYNGKRFLKEQMDSIRMQTIPPDEVVICDDGSGDGTAALIRNYIEKYRLSEKWRLIENKENLGFVENFCKAISLTKGKYIFLSDQDDVFYPDKFETMYKFMERHPDCYLLNAGFVPIDENGDRIKDIRSVFRFKRTESRKLTFDSWLYESSFPGFSMCFRQEIRDRLTKAGRTYCYGHDQLLGLIALDWDGNYEIGEILSGYRSHDSNVTGGKNLTDDVRLGARIRQKKQEYREYLLLEKLIEENEFSFHWNNILENRKKDLSIRIKCMQNRNIMPLLGMALVSDHYPVRTVLGDILYLLKRI